MCSEHGWGSREWVMFFIAPGQAQDTSPQPIPLVSKHEMNEWNDFKSRSLGPKSSGFDSCFTKFTYLRVTHTSQPPKGPLYSLANILICLQLGRASSEHGSYPPGLSPHPITLSLKKLRSTQA